VKPQCVLMKCYVIGGGNSAGRGNHTFLNLCKAGIINSESLTASLSHYSIKRITETNNIEVFFFNSEVTAINGNDLWKKLNNQRKDELFM